MTQDEIKAKELFDKFHYKICNDNGISESDSTEVCAKACALICVEEILDVLGGEGVWTFADIKIYNYWQAIKEAIEKL